jgi:hypothetical protein
MQENEEDDKGKRNREKRSNQVRRIRRRGTGKKGSGGDRRTGTDERRAHGKG